MAVINQADDKLTHPQNAGELTGARVLQVVKAISIAAGDDDASKYLIAELPGEACIDELTLEGAVITGATSYDVGIYDVDGNVISVAKFASNLDMSDATGLGTGPYGEAIRSALTALAPSDANKPLWELAGHVNKTLPAVGETQKKSKYRIVITTDTNGTGAGTLVARLLYRMVG